MLMPAQYKSSAPDSLTGTMRLFDTMSFRLFYSHNLDAVALGAAPSIAQVGATSAGGDVTFRMHVTDPVSDVQEVWVTYTALSGPLAGAWQSLDLTRDLVDQSLWTGTLNLGGATQPADLRYMVQAANGVGLVALATNQGEYFTPDIDPGRPTQPPGSSPPTTPAPTSLALVTPPSSGAYGNSITVVANLTNNAVPLPGQTVHFELGPLSVDATTDGSGQATADLLLLAIPGAYRLQATFVGTPAYAAALADAPFDLKKQGTVLNVTGPAAALNAANSVNAEVLTGADTGITVTLTTANNRVLVDRTVVFIIEGGADTFSRAVITDYAGRAPLGVVPLEAGSYHGEGLLQRPHPSSRLAVQLERRSLHSRPSVNTAPT